MLRLFLAAGALAFISGCFGNEATVFPPGLDPVEAENKAPPPPPVGTNLYPEVVGMVWGVGLLPDGEEYDWLHGRGYVRASPSRVWDALREPAVAADRRQVDEWSVELNAEDGEGIDFSFLLKNRVEAIITVNFDVTWRLGIVEGDADDPEVIAARYQKTFGTVLISLLQGSVVVRKLDDELVEIEYIEHISAAASGEEELKTYITDLHADIVDFAHGRELQSFDE